MNSGGLASVGSGVVAGGRGGLLSGGGIPASPLGRTVGQSVGDSITIAHNISMSVILL